LRLDDRYAAGLEREPADRDEGDDESRGDRQRTPH
jgi:hypothetical protein